LINNGKLSGIDILFPPGFVNFVTREKAEDIPAPAYPEIQAYGAAAVHPYPECFDWTLGGTGSGDHKKPGTPDTGNPDRWAGDGISSRTVFYLPDDWNSAGRHFHQIY
jgi:hypothetical protein